MRNQSVPILVSNLSNKPITNLQIANPFSQTTVSRYKDLALQKDLACRTFPLWFFFLVWTNYRRRWSAVSQPAGNFLHQSMLHSNVSLLWVRLWNVKTVKRCVSLYPEWEKWIWLHAVTCDQSIRHNIRTVGLFVMERTELATPSVTVGKNRKMQTVRLQNCGLLSSCLHRASMLIKLSTPNVNYSGRTALLTSKVVFYIFIQQI